MATTKVKQETVDILSRLEDNWIDTDIAMPNAGYQPTDSAYIEPVINRGEAFNADISSTSRRIRHPGLLTINVRVPLHTGAGTALEYADDLAEVFRNVTITGTGITFYAPTVDVVGRDGKWYRVQVDCPYQRDATY